jgi:hypothetical protein
MTRKKMRWVLPAAVAIFAISFGSQDAHAGKPERVFAGQIIVSKKRLPTKAKSANAFIKTLRKSKAKNFWEDKEKKRWVIYFAAFFKRPLNDLEVTVKFYDISSGSRRLMASFEQYLSNRGMQSLISKTKLYRKDFGVNKHIWMVVENRGKVLAQAKFKLLGEAEKYSGQVNFTEEETKGN